MIRKISSSSGIVFLLLGTSIICAKVPASRRSDSATRAAVHELLDAAIGEMKQVPDPDGKELARSMIVMTQVRTGDIEAAANMVGQMADGSWKAGSVREVATALAVEGQFDRALAMNNPSRYPLIQADTYARIGRAQYKAGDVAGAAKSFSAAGFIASQAPEADRRVLAWTELGDAQSDAGDDAGASDSFKRARAAAAQIDPGLSQDDAVANIAKAQAKHGKLDNAVATIASIAADRRTQACAELVDILCQGQHISEAQSLLPQITEPMRRVEAHYTIGEAQAKAGKIDDARKSFDAALAEMKNVQTYPDRVYLGIAESMARSFGIDAGKQILKLITPDDTRQEALRDFVQIAIERKEASKAIDLAKEISDPEQKAVAYASIAADQYKAKDIQNAAASLALAQKAADSIAEPFARMDAMSEVANAQLLAGDVTGAIHTISQSTSNHGLRCNHYAMAAQFCWDNSLP